LQYSCAHIIFETDEQSRSMMVFSTIFQWSKFFGHHVHKHGATSTVK